MGKVALDEERLKALRNISGKADATAPTEGTYYTFNSGKIEASPVPGLIGTDEGFEQALEASGFNKESLCPFGVPGWCSVVVYEAKAKDAAEYQYCVDFNMGASNKAILVRNLDDLTLLLKRLVPFAQCAIQNASAESIRQMYEQVEQQSTAKSKRS